MRSLIHMSAHMLLLLVTTSFLMDDNARPHRAGIVEGVSGGDHGLERDGIASSISRPESDRTSLGTILAERLLL
ncbi:hypothetical protein TNCV_1470521 [Trichonephila clavipes]|nr:hypothetical protein TNCV_1470521 [Trichonephila clavipes]